MLIKRIRRLSAWGNKRGLSRKTLLQVTAVVLVVLLMAAALKATVPARANRGELPLEANFSASQVFGQAPHMVQFSNLSTGNPEGWAWYFGEEELTEPWQQYNEHFRWSERYGHTSVVLGDGSVIVMGGMERYARRNDVWRSGDGGTTWTRLTANSGWSGRNGHASVVLADGSILVMGGTDGAMRNDVWRSENGGITWTQVTANAGWSGRHGHSSVVLSDGRILVMGGYDGANKNDLWESEDGGVTWNQVTANAGWSARQGHSSVVLANGSILVLGGSNTGDVWRSTDKGKNWTSVTSNAPWGTSWSGRRYQSTVVLSDGSILLLGGNLSTSPQNDVWRSTDQGANWTAMSTSAGWDRRYGHTSVVLPDDRVLVLGGQGLSHLSYFNDVWHSDDAGASWAKDTPTLTPARYGHTSVVLSDGSIITIGGSGARDVWRSDDGGINWTQVTGNAGWSGRFYHASVVLSDDSILVMGGYDSTRRNDVWRSDNGGATWTQVTANAGWSSRYYHTSVVLDDDSILVMGGNDGSNRNDVWRSVDGGATWTQVTANAGWSGRSGHTSNVLSDGSVLVMGGSSRRDVWRSGDGGATWTQVTADAGWATSHYGLEGHSSVILPDNSILVVGGRTLSTPTNNVWRSTDNGITWSKVTASSPWLGRDSHTSVVLKDGSVLVMGGIGNTHDALGDIWRLQTASSTEAHPQHTYTREGVYRVTLQAYTGKGYDRKTEFVYVGNYGLSALAVSEGGLEPAFNPNIFEYIVAVGSEVKSLDITADLFAGKKALLFINGVAASSGAPQKISLREGENTVSVTWAKWENSVLDITYHTYTVRIYRGVLSVTTQHLPVAVPGLPYSFSLEATGGTQSYTWSVSGLPAGLALVGSEVSGTVTQAGDYPLLVTAEDQMGNSSQKSFILRVREANGNGAFSVTPQASPAYTSGLSDGAIVTMTVKEGITGFQNFSVEVLPLTGHPGQEVLVFVHLRGDVQLGISAIKADFDNLQGINGGAGFNVQPGDVIKVYLVDQLSIDPDLSPRIL